MDDIGNSFMSTYQPTTFGSALTEGQKVGQELTAPITGLAQGLYQQKLKEIFANPPTLENGDTDYNKLSKLILPYDHELAKQYSELANTQLSTSANVAMAQQRTALQLQQTYGKYDLGTVVGRNQWIADVKALTSKMITTIFNQPTPDQRIQLTQQINDKLQLLYDDKDIPEEAKKSTFDGAALPIKYGELMTPPPGGSLLGSGSTSPVQHSAMFTSIENRIQDKSQTPPAVSLLDSLVASGKITEDEAKTLKEELTSVTNVAPISATSPGVNVLDNLKLGSSYPKGTFNNVNPNDLVAWINRQAASLPHPHGVVDSSGQNNLNALVAAWKLDRRENDGGIIAEAVKNAIGTTTKAAEATQEQTVAAQQRDISQNAAPFISGHEKIANDIKTIQPTLATAIEQYNAGNMSQVAKSLDDLKQNAGGPLSQILGSLSKGLGSFLKSNNPVELRQSLNSVIGEYNKKVKMINDDMESAALSEFAKSYVNKQFGKLNTIAEVNSISFGGKPITPTTPTTRKATKSDF